MLASRAQTCHEHTNYEDRLDELSVLGEGVMARGAPVRAVAVPAPRGPPVMVGTRGTVSSTTFALNVSWQRSWRCTWSTPVRARGSWFGAMDTPIRSADWKAV